MERNVFLENLEPCTLDSYLQYNGESRENLGKELPVLVYRMLEYSMKEELRRRYGREEQIAVFRGAGRLAGEYFARHYLNLEQPMDAFVGELQIRMEEFKIGILRMESLDEESGKAVLTLAEDADCSGLPILGETVCNFDEGFIAGVLSVYTGKSYEATEIDCWATGDRVCRFCAEVK